MNTHDAPFSIRAAAARCLVIGFTLATLACSSRQSQAPPRPRKTLAVLLDPCLTPPQSAEILRQVREKHRKDLLSPSPSIQGVAIFLLTGTPGKTAATSFARIESPVLRQVPRHLRGRKAEAARVVASSEAEGQLTAAYEALPAPVNAAIRWSPIACGISAVEEFLSEGAAEGDIELVIGSDGLEVSPGRISFEAKIPTSRAWSVYLRKECLEHPTHFASILWFLPQVIQRSGSELQDPERKQLKARWAEFFKPSTVDFISVQ